MAAAATAPPGPGSNLNSVVVSVWNWIITMSETARRGRPRRQSRARNEKAFSAMTKLRPEGS
jgi:hypothetical protein